MARRDRESAPESTQTDEQVAEQATETTVTEAPAEAPTSTDEQIVAQPAEAKPAETPIDLGPFQKSVTEAVAQRDPSGELPTEAYGPVNEAYAALKGQKAKNQAKAWLSESMGKLINEAPNKPGTEGMQLVFEARALMLVQNQLTTAGSSTKEPSDPTEAYVERFVSIALARQLVAETQPEGVSEDWATKAEALASSDKVTEGIQAYKAWLANTAEDKGDAPEVPSVVSNAFKLAQGKAARKSGGSGRTGTPHEGPNRSVPKHMLEYFADKAEGHEATVAEIAKFDSVEYGSGADHPSSGAITARLKPKSGKVTLEGIEPVMVNGHLGARKVAA